MTERGAHALERDAQSIAIGPSNATWNGATLELSLREIAVPIPRAVRGTVRVTPQCLTTEARDISPHGHHSWWPIAPHAHVELLLEEPALSWTGDGYLDTNWGDRPLERDFLTWQWSRAHTRKGTAIIYDCQLNDGSDHSLALMIDQGGQATDLDLPVDQTLPKSRWLIDRSTRSSGAAAVKVDKTLEDTPFYARSLLSTEIGGEQTLAMHESLSLQRFSTAWVKALLPWRMPRSPF